MQNIWTFSVEIAPLSIYLIVLIIHLFQYVIFISQNVILKWQFKICVHAVLNYMGFCGENQVRTECWLPPCSQLLRNSGVLS